MPFSLIDTRIELYTPDGSQDASHRIALSVEPTGPAPRLSVIVDANERMLDLAGTWPNEPEKAELIALTLAAPGNIPDILGMKLGASTTATPKEVRLEIRPRAVADGDSGGPFLALFITWTLEATVGDAVDPASGASVSALEVGASVAVDVRVGFAAMAQTSELGVANFAVRLDVVGFGITSNWIPLALLDVATWSAFEMPGLLDWFAKIVGVTIPDLPAITWDVDLPLSITLPLGLRLKESAFRIAPADGRPRVHLEAKGLVLRIGSIDLPHDDFRLDLVWNGASYTLRVVLAEWKRAPGGDGEFLKLPFRLLRASAAAWRLRLGFFAHDDRACFDTVLEVGGLKLEYGEGRKLYEANLRIHLRDLRVLTAPPTTTRTLFEGEGAEYDSYKIPIPRLTFAESPAGAGTPNDYGIEFLDGAVDTDSRLFLAWRQNGNQFLKALSSDLFGTVPAGSIPGDANTLVAGIEIASFASSAGGRDLQLRFDWRESTAAVTAVLPALPAVPPPAGRDEEDHLCFDADDLRSGIVLPVPATPLPDMAAITAGADAIALSLLGLTLRLARPSSQSIVYRAEADGVDSLAWLANYDPAPSFAAGRALAEAVIDFSLADTAGGARQVQPSSAAGSREPFLRALLGGTGSGATSVAIAGWREGERPRFLQVYASDRPFTSLIPAPAANNLGEDECPGAPPVDRAALPLPSSAFIGFRLREAGLWQLALQTRLLESALKLFGEGRSVNVKITEVCVDAHATAVLLATELTVALTAETTVEGTVRFRFGLDDLALSVEGPARLTVDLPVDDFPAWTSDVLDPIATKGSRISKPLEFLGFELRALRTGTENTPIGMLALTFDDGRFVLGVPDGSKGTKDVDLLLRHQGFGGTGLVFRIDRFALGTGGLDLDATLIPVALKLPGLSKPFALNAARLSIVGGRMQDLMISGSGNLPDLLNAAPVEISVRMAQNPGGNIVLKEFDCSLGDGDAPIFTRGVRCRFELTKLTIDMDDAGGTREAAWFFRISGSLQFHPEGAEFAGNLLEDFDSIRCEFANAPLGDEFFEHIELVATLTRPRRFKVLKLFDMEVRGIGFHPRYPSFDRPAIIIAGQIAFADIGDVLSVDVDFHRLYLGLPNATDRLPPVEAKGLRIAISSSGFKIAGRVEYMKDELIDGFGGEGTVLIPGLPELSAAFAFAKLRAVATDGWKRGWFIAIEVSRISYQIGSLPLYLRQIGLGFGYRYTSVMIKRLEDEPELGALIKLMLAELAQHQTLARLSSWAPDPERDDGGSPRWSIGFEAVLSMTSANSAPTKYDPAGERKLKTLILQLLVFLRSDFTFLAAAKLWFPVSTDDFFEDAEAMRSRPLALGFVSYQPSKSRLLAHAAKGKNPYFGRADDRPVPDQVIKILDDSHFEATFLSEPGVLHAELGWPDRLFFNFRIGPLTLECRGGILYRLDREMLVHGVFFSGRGNLTVGGGVSAGIVGAEVRAEITVAAAMRLMIGLRLTDPTRSAIYAVTGLDVAVRFSIHAWFRLNLRFCKIKIDIGFSIELQLVVVLEIGWAGAADLGCRARATLVIGAFGRQLKITARASILADNVDDARAVLAPYMGSFLEPGAVPPIPGLGGGALFDVRGMRAPVFPAFAPSTGDAAAVGEPLGDRFVFARMRGQKTTDGRRLWFGWVIPSPKSEFFYPVSPVPAAEVAYARLSIPPDAGVQVFAPQIAGDQLTWIPAGAAIDLSMHADAKVALAPVDGGAAEELTLIKLLAGCHEPPASATEPGYFPSRWGDDDDLMSVGRAAHLFTRKADADERILDPNDPARATRRNLDPNNPYDKKLMQSVTAHFDATAGSDDAAGNLEQAHGAQAWLLRTFTEDLDAIASRTRFDAGAPTATPLPGGRPSIGHLGLLVCVVAAECPPWLGAFSGGHEQAHIDFLMEHHGPDTVHFAGKIGPVLDFNTADFETNPPDIRERASYFDEETLNFAWDLDWGPRGDPDSVLGRRPDITQFLAACEVVITVEGEEQPVDRARVLPVDILVDPTLRLPPRYQYSRSVAALGLDPGDSLSLETRVTATIRPIAQDRSVGGPLSMTAVYRPRATPLAADDVTFIVRFKPDRTLTGSLTWRELVPPNDPGVLAVRRRELVLRPLRRLPLGAFPEEAADADDSGLASALGSGLRDGDIVIALSDKLRSVPPTSLPRVLPENETAPAPAQQGFAINFDDDLASLVAGVFDHLGRRLESTSQQALLAFGFLRRRPATAAAGSGWNVFVRTAANDLEPVKDLPAVGYAAPIRARILLDQVDPEGTPKMRVLDHLEWLPPRTDAGTHQLTEVAATVGLIHTANLVDADTIEYLPRPGRERGVTLRWSAQPAADRPIEKVAAYQLYEARMDALVNLDRVEAAGFGTEWQKIHEVKPIDVPFAGRAVTSFVQPEIWEASSPSFAATLSFLHRIEVPSEEMTAKWPGWFSWNESELKWPPFVPSVDATLAEMRAAGDFVAKRSLHPYLAILVAHLSAQGATAIGGAPGTTFTVEVSAGKAVKLDAGEGSAGRLPDPITWMQQDVENADPLGWGGLHHFGLAVSVALRDPVSGVYLTQSQVRREIQVAREAVRQRVASFADLAESESYLAMDLPLQHERAVTTEIRRTLLAESDPIALSMVQLTLRPRPVWLRRGDDWTAHRGVSYSVFHDPDGLLSGEGHPVRLRADLSVIYLDDPVRTAMFPAADTEIPFRTILPGTCRRAVLSWRSSAPPSTAFRIGDHFWSEQLAERPVPLVAAAEDPALTPFGLFPLQEDVVASALMRTDVLPDQPPQLTAAPYYQGFLDHLVQAFPGATADELKQDALLPQAYIRWSARYFRSASVDNRIATLVAPKGAMPSRMAPDGRGTLAYTHPIREDLASLRSYAVRVVDRYHMLQTGAEPPEPDGFAPESCVDVDIPRRRKLVAPKAVGLRLLTTPDAVEYHELALSEHVEQALSRANLLVARKLEFQDLRRRYTMAFAFDQWVDDLEAEGLVADVSWPPDLAPGRAEAPPDGLGADTFLATAPLARFGGLRIVTPAEAFYYKQTVTVVARAVSVQSPPLEIALPAPNAIPPLPADASPTIFAPTPDWSAFEDLSARHAKLANVLRGHAVVPYLLPRTGARITTRFPRLFEHIAPAALAGHLAGERLPRTFGCLPDPLGRIEIVAETSGARATIAVVEPRKDASLIGTVIVNELSNSNPAVCTVDASDISKFSDGMRVRIAGAIGTSMTAANGVQTISNVNAEANTFVLASVNTELETSPQISGVTATPTLFVHRNVSNELTAAPIDYPAPSASWHEGLPFSVDVFKAWPLPLADEIAVAVREAADRKQFATDRVARLAALSVRLRVEGAADTWKVTEIAPLDGPRWLYRPSLDAAGEISATQADREIGLRLVLDHTRLAAAELAGDDVDLLHEIETKQNVILSEPFPQALDVRPIDAALAQVEHTLWLHDSRAWRPIDTIPPEIGAGERFLILGDLNEAVYAAAAAAQLPLPDPPPTAAEAAALAALARTLAELHVLRRVVLSVVAHHGNLPPARWGDSYGV
ncbi:hypothetical protein [Bradyrhizobium diversitatis]|uniref:LysM domain-containing protein n=1 Tax=Bradyrhizobium diversitatis TaxID=2755406 RepID=A0ABS0P080_9BRAD|nr:hypothetical protein [Bradyrhizobium diversitatis]MBH5386662.1 hypothetical protein [Bradyrhizobium diversitatis]